MQTASFRKPVPLSIPIQSTPAATPASMAEVAQPTPSSGHHAPSILIPRSTSPLPPLPSTPQPQNAVAGPSQPRRRDTGSARDSDEERAVESGPESAQLPPPLAHGSSTDNGSRGGNGYAPQTHSSPHTSIRHPARAVSYSDRTVRGADRQSYPQIPVPKSTLPPTPGPIPYATGTGIPGELNHEGMTSQRSNIDWIVPNLGRDTRRQSAYSHGATLATANGEKSIGDRLDPTLRSAREEREKASVRGERRIFAKAL